MLPQLGHIWSIKSEYEQLSTLKGQSRFLGELQVWHNCFKAQIRQLFFSPKVESDHKITELL